MAVEQIGAFAFAILFFVVGLIFWIKGRLLIVIGCAAMVFILALYAAGIIGAAPAP